MHVWFGFLWLFVIVPFFFFYLDMTTNLRYWRLRKEGKNVKPDDVLFALVNLLSANIFVSLRSCLPGISC